MIDKTKDTAYDLDSLKWYQNCDIDPHALLTLFQNSNMSGASDGSIWRAKTYVSRTIYSE